MKFMEMHDVVFKQLIDIDNEKGISVNLDYFLEPWVPMILLHQFIKKTKAAMFSFLIKQQGKQVLMPFGGLLNTHSITPN